MILEPHMRRLVLAGKKTEIRQLGNLQYRVGQSYPVRTPKGKANDVRVLVTSAEPQRLGDITYDEARREGHKTTDEFKSAWLSENDEQWSEPLGNWFEDFWADRWVWVIGFKLEADRSLFLAPAGRPKWSEKGYTPAGDVLRAGEVVGDLEQARQSKRAREKWANGAEGRLHLVQKQPLDKRLARVLREASFTGRDVSSQLRVIERLVEKLEREEQRHQPGPEAA